MSAKIINGKILAKNIIHNISNIVNNKILEGYNPPGLAVILIGENQPSELYVNNKIALCNSVGFFSKVFRFSKFTNEDVILNLIDKLNIDSSIHGIIVQLPIPKNINANKILSRIDINKDVDFLNPLSFGKYVNNIIYPCTPSAIDLILKTTLVNFNGLTSVILGTSNIVGKPLIFKLLSINMTVIILTKDSNDFYSFIRKADVLVVAIGKPNFINGNLIKPGSIVIDVGINYINDNLFIGDVDFNSAYEIAGWITPVPGGVGPLTVAYLLHNTLVFYLNNL